MQKFPAKSIRRSINQDCYLKLVNEILSKAPKSMEFSLPLAKQIEVEINVNAKKCFIFQTSLSSKVSLKHKMNIFLLSYK